MSTQEFIESLAMQFAFSYLSEKVDEARMVLWIPRQHIYYEPRMTYIDVCISDWHGTDQWYMQLACGNPHMLYLTQWGPNESYHVEMTDAQRTAFIAMRQEYGEALTTTVQKKTNERIEWERADYYRHGLNDVPKK